MKLNSQHFLVLDFDIQADVHRVKLVPDLDHSFENWGPNVRISPVWSLGRVRDKVSLILSDDDIGMAFLAGANPGSLQKQFGDDLFDTDVFSRLWFSLGTFNVVVVLRAQDGASRLVEYCRDKNIAMELWTFTAGGYDPTDGSAAVQEMHYYPAPSPAEQPERVEEITRQILQEHNRTEEHFRSLFIELASLLSIAIKRSEYQQDGLTKDFAEIGKQSYRFVIDPPALRKNSKASEAQKSRVLSGIHNINAGLSRLTSQALSGATPISKTECHFWPHSLLGIGTANRALRNVVAYISDIISTYGFTDRLNHYFDESYSWQKPIMQLGFEQLMSAFPLDKVKVPEAGKTVGIVPITYFSGRDGFKNSIFTTSAPLMSIQAGNAYQYSLVTITHEVSHRIVSAAIALMLQRFGESKPTVWNVATEISNTRKKIFRIFYDLFVIYSLTVFETINGKVHEDTTKDPLFLEMLLTDLSEDFEEHLVHIFDYWYFFRREDVPYVTTIWSSWAVLPNISLRLEDYVVRTFVALSANYIGPEGWRTKVRDVMVGIFKELEAKKSLHLAAEVVAMLSGERLAQIEKKVNSRLFVIKAFHLLFSSEELSGLLATELLRSEGSSRSRAVLTPTQGYTLKDKTITLTRFGNAIKFLAQYSANDRADPTSSAWLLYMLAFNWWQRGAA
ncbi:hypothetical protein ACU8KI_16735 [Rhizobium leguminosarum]